MNYINNKDIKILWSIYKGVSMNREKFDRANVLKVFVRNSKNLIPVEYIIDEEGVITISLSKNMLVPDIYSLYAVWIKNDHEGIVPEGHGAFRCVSKSEKCNLFGVTEYADEDEVDSAVVTIVVKSNVMNYGYDGLSAYEMAVVKGKTSLSEEEWIAAQSGAATMYGSLQSQINEIIAGGAEPQVSVSPSVVLVGQSALTVKGTVKKNATALTLYKGASASGEAVASGSGTSVSGTSTINETSNGVVYFSLKAVINGVAVTTTGQVKVEMPVYAGFGATIADVAGVTSKKLSARSSANGTYTATASANGQKYFIVVPNYMSKLSNFSMGGTPFVMANGATTIDGVSYNYYVSGSAYNSGTKLTITAS